MFLQDRNNRFTSTRHFTIVFIYLVLTRSAMGAGSLREGEIDIMLDRKLIQDDQVHKKLY